MTEKNNKSERHFLNVSRLRSRLLTAVAVLVTAGQGVLAADLPAGIDPGQLEKRFDDPLEPRSQIKPIEVPRTEQSAPPTGAEQMRFTLRQLQISGVTAFEQSEIMPLFAERLDTEVSLATIYELAGKLTAFYGNSGYILSRAIVPAQTIDNGQVRIHVIEGFIDEVSVTGLEGRRSDLLDHYIREITSERPLHISTLERYLLLANDLPGLELRAVLKASETTPGAATLTLIAQQQAWSGTVSIDNRGSESSGPTQMMVGVTVNDLLQRLDTTTLRYVFVPQPDETEELRYLQFRHHQVINGEGLSADLTASVTNSEPGGKVLTDLGVESRGYSISSSIHYPLTRSRAENLTLGAGMGLRESETYQLGAMTANDRLATTHISLDYDRSDAWAGGGVTLFSLTLSRGIDAFGAQVESRSNASPDYTKAVVLLRRNQRINRSWSADMRLTGQLSDDTLPAAEQYGIGGESNLRGYEPAEWTGDKAFTSSLELNYRIPVNFTGKASLYGFVEQGTVWRNSPLPGEIDESRALSSGMGVRVNLPHEITLNMEAAKPHSEDAQGEVRDWQYYGRLSVGF